MKLTKEQLERLKALSVKTDPTDAEKTELSDLQVKAKAAGIETDAKSIDAAIASLEDAVVTEADLKAAIETAVKSAVKESQDSDKLVAEIVKALKPKSEITPDSVASLVAEAVKAAGSTDAKVVAEAVQKALAPAPKQVTLADVQDVVQKALASFRPEGSKMVHPTSNGIELPISHRAGNLSVAQKQLLNICLMNAADVVRSGKAPRDMNEGIPESLLAKAKAATEANRTRMFQSKALTVGGSGSGADFVATDLSGTLESRFYLQSALAQAMLSSEINMPTNVFELPLRTTRPTFYLGSEATATTKSDIGTGNVTLTSKKFMGHTSYSYEIDEDSVLAVMPLLESELVTSAVDAFEGAIINGDTAATHQDSDIHAVSAHASKAFDGLRKLALAVSGLKSDISSGGYSVANIGALRKKMVRWGINPSQLLMVVGPKAYNDLVLLSDKLTVEKTGTDATINTGTVTQLFGIPTVISSQNREDLNASGVYDGTTTTKGSLLLVHRPSWYVGVRRGFLVESFRDIQTQTTQLVCSFRRAFSPIETPHATTAAIVGIGYNATA